MPIFAFFGYRKLVRYLKIDAKWSAEYRYRNDLGKGAGGLLPELQLTAVIMPIGALPQCRHDFIGNRAKIGGHCLNRIGIMN